MDDAVSLTQLIHRAAQGDADAADRLFAAMYGELRRLARARLRAGGRNTVLDTSSLEGARSRRRGTEHVGARARSRHPPSKETKERVSYSASPPRAQARLA